MLKTMTLGVAFCSTFAFAMCDGELKLAARTAETLAAQASTNCKRGYITATSKEFAGAVFFVGVPCDDRTVSMRVSVQPGRADRCYVSSVREGRPTDQGEGYCEGMYGRGPCHAPEPYYGPQPQ